jgi:hypothetical protein
MTVWEKFEFPIRSIRVFNEFVEEFDRRKESNSCNFPQAGATLTTEGHWEPRYLKKECYQVTPSSLERPTYITPPVRERHVELDGLSAFGTVIILTRLLSPVFPRMKFWKAQIWTARVGDREVVAKIYQACFSSERPTIEHRRDSLDGFYPEEEEAHREAWAYNQLLSLQGTVIPHSYGFFKVSVHLCFRNCIILKSLPCRPSFLLGMWRAFI